jgi:3'(2'), 5'-bisphosphate nucleotidase
MFIDELTLAIFSSLKAGKLILEVYEQPNNEVMQKSDLSPITLADIRSHDSISQDLKDSGLPIVSEEGDPAQWEAIRKSKRYWLIDPLDGTREFINKNNEFTVNIALIEDEIPVMGVIYVPCLKTLYAGVVGKGAWMWNNIGSEKDFSKEDVFFNSINLPLFKSNDVFTVVGSKSHLTSATEKFIAKLSLSLKPIAFIQAGSSLKLCKVATGEADLYPRMDSIMEWDTAAGQAILEAAGGKMKRWPSGEAIKMNSVDVRTPFFLAIAPSRDENIFFD